MHTLLDLRGQIPTFIHISDGKIGDVNVLDLLVPEPGAYYVMDRGYVDFTAPVHFASERQLLCHSCKEGCCVHILLRTSDKEAGALMQSEQARNRRIPDP